MKSLITGHTFWVNPGFQAAKKWGFFLDRDGVIIEDVHLLHRMEDYVIFPQALQAIKLLNDNQVPVVMATNQTVVARGLVDEAFIEQIHQRIKDDLAQVNAHIDAIVTCLHSPQADIKTYRFVCDWRKPEAGMMLYAVDFLGLDRTRSYGIGDKARDCLAYQKAGMKDILVLTGHGGEDAHNQAIPTVVKEDILEAVRYILEQESLV